MENQNARDAVIGKKIWGLTDEQTMWMDDRWPGIDDGGAIREVYDSDNTPQDQPMINWHLKDGKFAYEEVDGEHGFDAILE